jgi:chromosome segregation ATPase
VNATLVVALVGLIGGPLVAYFGVARRASGKIGTSEAGQLWEESRAIRDWATERINELNEIVRRLEKQVADLQRRNESLHLENGRLTETLDEHEQTIAELRSQVHRLSDDNERLKKENVTLRGRVSELEANDA